MLRQIYQELTFVQGGAQWSHNFRSILAKNWDVEYKNNIFRSNINQQEKKRTKKRWEPRIAFLCVIRATAQLRFNRSWWIEVRGDYSRLLSSIWSQLLLLRGVKAATAVGGGGGRGGGGILIRWRWSSCSTASLMSEEVRMVSRRVHTSLKLGLSSEFQLQPVFRDKEDKKTHNHYWQNFDNI